MIFRLVFDHPSEAAAFRLYCEEEGIPAPVETSDRYDCPYPKNRILEVDALDAPDEFVDIWGNWIASIGF